MLKKLVLTMLATLTAGHLLNADVAYAAPKETTIWTIKCSTSGQTRKIKVLADSRATARAMVEKEATSSGFCLQTFNLEFIKVEAVKAEPAK